MTRALTGTFLLLASIVACASDSVPPPRHDMNTMWQEMLKKPALSPSAVFDSQGVLWLAEVHDGFLYVRHSADKGKTFGAPVQVNRERENIAADGENRPKLAFGKHSAVYVSYTTSLDKPFTGNVRFARSLDGGRHWQEPLTVNDNHDIITHRFEALGVNERGQIFMAWLDKRDQAAAMTKGEKYRGAALYGALSDDGGVSFGPNLKLADHTCECCRLAMAMDRDGIPVIFWRAIFADDIRDHALLRWDGTSAVVRVSHDQWQTSSCPHHGPTLGIDAAGTYHLAWFNNAPARRGLFYARSRDGGQTFAEPVAFGAPDAQPTHPYVLALGDEVRLVWKEFDGERSVIRTMHSTDGGNQWHSPRTVASTAGGSDHPLLIADGDAAYLVWNTLKDGLRIIAIDETRP